MATTKAMTNRREFLRGAFWVSAAASFGGCRLHGGLSSGGHMATFAAPCMELVRVACVGIGARGMGGVHRLSIIPGSRVTALCDVDPSRVAEAQAWLKDNGFPPAREFVGPEAWKALCDWDGADVVYNTTPWQFHAPIALRAMEAGKHAFVEVPGAMTVDECWSLVEASERTRRHCMMLENCCYGEEEMLALRMCREGVFGDLTHGECGYVHEMKRSLFERRWENWRVKWNSKHRGNLYPTHGLGPICQYMNVNRGDRLDYLVSLECAPAALSEYARTRYAEGDWRRDLPIASGDMNSTLIRTVNGRSILLQHDVVTPRPYDRNNLIAGTKGILRGFPLRIFVDSRKKDEDGFPRHQFLGDAETEALRAKYRHPLWAQAGEIAKKVGGHGGKDFLMDLRWVECLRGGLPLDQNVYDLATWSSMVELTECSVASRSSAVDVPDFTRGGWRTTPPLRISGVDLDRSGVRGMKVFEDAAQLSV